MLNKEVERERDVRQEKHRNMTCHRKERLVKDIGKSEIIKFCRSSGMVDCAKLT